VEKVRLLDMNVLLSTRPFAIAYMSPSLFYSIGYVVYEDNIRICCIWRWYSLL